VFAEGDYERAFELLERSAAVCEETGFSWFQGVALVGLAERNQEIGRHGDAAGWAREALVVVSRTGDRQAIVYSLAILARAAAEQGDQQRAGRLWGALEREAERGPIGQWEAQGEGDQYAAAVLARTGAEFERARQEGRRLALDAAVELALAAS
jgi:hypothetical protein